MKSLFNLTLSLTALLFAALPAQAYEPKPTELLQQEAASPTMERLHHFHDGLLMWIITAIVIFVFILLVIVAVKFNAKSNPTPSQTTHHVGLEIAWTLVPVLILIVIAVPSFKLLYYLDRTETPDLTLKATGYQWGWTYTYPDYEGLEFNADIIRASKNADGSPSTPAQDVEEINKYIPDGKGRRLLETYNPVVLPVNKNIQIITTANDVIHAWTVPAFGAKKDAVPGRLNETWTRIERTGVYYGQCSEICGIDHSSMPISVYAVLPDEFTAWTECVKGDGAKADFPARECVDKLGFNKYRVKENQIALDVTTLEETEAADTTAETGDDTTDQPAITPTTTTETGAE